MLVSSHKSASPTREPLFQNEPTPLVVDVALGNIVHIDCDTRFQSWHTLAVELKRRNSFQAFKQSKPGEPPEKVFLVRAPDIRVVARQPYLPEPLTLPRGATPQRGVKPMPFFVYCEQMNRVIYALWQH